MSSKAAVGLVFVVLLIVIIAVGWSNASRINQVSAALDSVVEALSELEEAQQAMTEVPTVSEEEMESLIDQVVNQALPRVRDLIDEAEEALEPPPPEPLDDMPVEPPVGDAPGF